ncbi:MAG: glycyl-radical enzyme activating protein [Anaerolineales bacterium]|nr:glycyl-radical enzyme activating protein [Anaerolineales bacterium]
MGCTTVYTPARCDTCGACVQVCPQEVYAYVGEQMDSNQLARELLRDRAFYEVSNGGVTFSGGEAALQEPFVYATALRLQEENAHVALDTAGNVAWECLEILAPMLDLVLYDIKFSQTENHRHWLGIGNELILDNLERLSRTKIPIWIRLIILPGLNDTTVEIQDRLTLAASTRNVERVDLLPYHTYGIGKYSRLGRDYRLPEMQPPSREKMEEILELARSYGLNAHIGG